MSTTDDQPRQIYFREPQPEGATLREQQQTARLTALFNDLEPLLGIGEAVVTGDLPDA
ncbi:MAG: hypothetical protein ACK5LO_04950 [Leucobacter sp.]